MDAKNLTPPAWLHPSNRGIEESKTETPAQATPEADAFVLHPPTDVPFEPLPAPDPEDERRDRQRKTRAEGRCGSLSTFTGEPCRRFPRPGATVCVKHGARAPQTAAKAERLLAIARLPAIQWIMDALDQSQEETCNSCGFPTHSPKERKRLDSLAFKLLDRTGFGPRQTIGIEAQRSEQTLDVTVMTPREIEELDELLDALEGLKARVQLRIAREAVPTGDEPRALLPSSSSVGD